jgi:hypothetical protein
MPAAPARSATPVAAAMRRMRERRRAGLSVIKVLVPFEELGELLVDAKLLQEWDVDNRAAVEAALSAFVMTKVREAAVMHNRFEEDDVL